jgi:hypothetical protein
MGRSQDKAACDDLSSPKEDRHAIASETREFFAELHPVGRIVEIQAIAMTAVVLAGISSAVPER